MGPFNCTSTPSTQACFFSDLHLFARRSAANDYLSALTEAVRRSEFVVLGGDILDFRWSTLASEEATADAGQQWLESLLLANPRAQFHYVCGNHDCARSWTGRLEQLASDHSQFCWHEFGLLANTTLFMHGDVADRWTAHEELVERRRRWSEGHRAMGPRHLLYEVAVGLRLHNLASRLWHSSERTVERIDHYIKSLDLPTERPVDQVVFGHTHRLLDGHRADGVRYFNGGAPLTGNRFRILEVRI